MLSRREQREVAQVVEAFAAMLDEAVAATVAGGGPDPGRLVARRALELDEHPDGGGPGGVVMTYLLLQRLGGVRHALSGDPERVDQVLAWIGEHLGPRFRARARYTSGTLRSEEDAAEVPEYVDALRDDFYPSLIWLLAGAVACFGDGDVDWLHRVQAEAAQESPTS